MKLLYRFAILITWLLLPHLAHATAQIPDNIVYERQEYSLHVNPLEQYFAQGHSKPEIFNEGIISSACWRGYVATWEIRDQKLYLKKLEKEYEKDSKNDNFETEWREIPLTVIFPNAQEMVHAQWSRERFVFLRASCSVTCIWDTHLFMKKNYILRFHKVWSGK